MRRDRPPLPPLDPPALERLALRYAERFATTQGRLVDYLRRKVRERGWSAGSCDPEALAARMAALGYVDDRGYAEAKASAMARRGLGARRVTGALRQARVGGDDLAAVAGGIDARALDAALTFARRKRIGPFAQALADRETRQRLIGAMARAGHPFALARRIVEAAPGEAIGAADALDGGDEDDPC